MTARSDDQQQADESALQEECKRIEEEDTRVLEHELAEIKNSVRMLEESNRELEQALKDGPDEDFEQALRENEQVLVRKRALIEKIESVLQQAREFNALVGNRESCNQPQDELIEP